MKRNILALAAASLCILPIAASASTLYSSGLNATDAANWNVYSANTTSDAVFGYDYSANGIPVAPHTTDGSTVGLKFRSDFATNTTTPAPAIGAISASPNNLAALTTPFTVSVDFWGNYALVGGSNSTEAAMVGVGTSGAQLMSPLGNDGTFFDVFHDGGTTTSYRAYTHNGTAVVNNPASSGYFFAGTQNPSNAYYGGLFPAHAAPVSQQSDPSVGSGNTPSGVTGFAWHTFQVTDDGVYIAWLIDGHSIATVPVSAAGAFGGGNIMLGFADSNLSAGTTAVQNINFELFDNLVITDNVTVPEPATLGLAGVIGLGAMARRRRA